jgi:ferric-dicitrate binding protein FerR (iron transport regulator)
MEEQTTYYNSLIAAYFSGEASPEEITKLLAWLALDASNLELFEEYRNAWVLTGKDAINSKIDLDREWASITSRIENKENPSLTQLPSERKGRTLKLLLSWKAAAALVVLLVAASALFYLATGNKNIVITADSGNLEQVLPDGSEITLYQGSTIEYPTDFISKTRRVKLEGEAYFNVKHDAKHPFIVSGEDLRIEVLGTSFNVNTKAGNDKINVVLTTGKISLYFDDHRTESTILNPGEKADISVSAKNITTGKNTDPNYMAWKTGKITFDNTNLNQVIATLSKVFHKEIRLADQQLSGCSLTATFENQSLTQILNVIGVTLDLEISEENGLIFVKGTSCY